MSTEQVKEIVTRLQDETHVTSIGLSGGEPLLRKDLAEILAFLRKEGIAPVIISNGSLLKLDRVTAMAQGNTFQVTLLSHRAEVHDTMAGRRGAWDDAVDGMVNIRRTGGMVTAVFVATSLNCADLPQTAELAVAIGAQGIVYNRVNLGAHNYKWAASVLPTPDMIRVNLDWLEDFGSKYGLPVVASVVIEPCVVDVRRYQHIRFGWCPLGGEDSYFTISPTGDVRICNHSSIVLGNLFHQRFSDIYYHHPYINTFRETWPEECRECDPELRALCRGGCRAAAEQCFGTLSRVDPFVTLSRPYTLASGVSRS